MLLVAEAILGDEEKDSLRDVIDSNWITMGSRVRLFERAFAEHHGAQDAAAVSSCTAALHLLLAAHGIGPGDEVLVPSLTFVATVNSVLYVGAEPVFVDIESIKVPLLSIRDAAAKCTAKTRAVVLMHYAGCVADLPAWRDFADRNGLLLLEDAAHAVGVDGVGRVSDGAAFSFYGNKNMTTAEGGAVLANDPEVLDRVRQMRGHGMVASALQRLASRRPDYDVTMLGFNYRMDELRAAMGLVQLQRLPHWNMRRKQLADLYQRCLAQHCPEVAVPLQDSGTSAHHIMPVVLPQKVERWEIIGALQDRQIQTTMHYPPAHQLSFYRRQFPGVHLPNTEEFGRRQLTLPLHPRMDDADVQSVVTALATALRQQEAFA